MLVSSCARPPADSHVNTSPYAGVLPTKNNLVFYRSAATKTGITSQLADSRARYWFRSSGRVLNVVEQNPIRRKTDLVYLALLPAHRVPVDGAGVSETLPALRFWVTVDNTGDSTRIVATNFEVADARGNYQAVEKQPYTNQQQWVSMWLADVDAAVTEMIASLTAFVTQPENR